MEQAVHVITVLEDIQSIHQRKQACSPKADGGNTDVMLSLEVFAIVTPPESPKCRRVQARVQRVVDLTDEPDEDQSSARVMTRDARSTTNLNRNISSFAPTTHSLAAHRETSRDVEAAAGNISGVGEPSSDTEDATGDIPSLGGNPDLTSAISEYNCVSEVISPLEREVHDLQQRLNTMATASTATPFVVSRLS